MRKTSTISVPMPRMFISLCNLLRRLRPHATSAFGAGQDFTGFVARASSASGENFVHAMGIRREARAALASLGKVVLRRVGKRLLDFAIAESTCAILRRHRRARVGVGK